MFGGLEIRDQHLIDRIKALQRGANKEGMYKGRLLLPKTAEEVLENDGTHGRPLWVIVGSEVFDITGTRDFGLGTSWSWKACG